MFREKYQNKNEDHKDLVSTVYRPLYYLKTRSRLSFFYFQRTLNGFPIMTNDYDNDRNISCFPFLQPHFLRIAQKVRAISFYTTPSPIHPPSPTFFYQLSSFYFLLFRPYPFLFFLFFLFFFIFFTRTSNPETIQLW